MKSPCIVKAGVQETLRIDGSRDFYAIQFSMPSTVDSLLIALNDTSILKTSITYYKII